MESDKATILCDTKTPRHPYTHVNFHDATLGDIVRASFHKLFLVKPIMILTKFILLERIFLLVSVDGMLWFTAIFPQGTRYLLHIFIMFYLVLIHILNSNHRSSLLMKNKYRHAKTTFIHVPRHNFAHFQSLFDWGENGVIHG